MNCKIDDLPLNSNDTIAPMDKRTNRETATMTPIATEFLKKVIFIIYYFKTVRGSNKENVSSFVVSNLNTCVLTDTMFHWLLFL